MNEPVTTLDERFSEDGASPTSWRDTRQALESSELFWVTTVRVDGRPHVTPLVAVWSEDALYFSTGPEEQKAANLRANDHVILLTGRNEWNEGLDVVVEGSATRVTSHEDLARVAEVWTHKWDGRWTYALGEGCFHHRDGEQIVPEAVWVFEVRPEKILAFAKNPFSHTRHTF